MKSSHARSLLLWVVVTSAAGMEAAQPAVSSLHAAHLLTNEQASHGLRASFEATVTYYRKGDEDLFVQDGPEGIYVKYKAGAGLRPGDRVRIAGTTKDSFRPIVVAEQVVFLRHGTMPEPVSAPFDPLNSAQLDCRWVTLRAKVRSADVVGEESQRETYLQTVMPGGTVDVAIDNTDVRGLHELLDAEVQITGVATAKFDSRRELAGVRIHVPSLSGIRVLRASSTLPDTLPNSAMEDVYGSYRVTDESRRVRVRGVVTYYQPGATLVIQNGDKSTWVRTLTSEPLELGQVVEVSGFPQLSNDFPTLNMAEVHPTTERESIQAIPVTWDQLMQGESALRVIRMEGRLVREVHQAAMDEYVLESAGNVFSAVYRHPAGQGVQAAGMPSQIPRSTGVRVTGIGMFSTADPFDGPIAAQVLLRSADDIVVIAPPRLINLDHMVKLAGFLVLVVVIVGARGWWLERRVRHESASAARYERLRSSILEDINRARPIDGILSKVVDLLSIKLGGAASWCQLEGGATIGRPPEATEKLHVVELAIPSHSGKPLGKLLAAIPRRRRMNRMGPDALRGAAQLAALALETAGLYSDLVYRSQYDQLTDIHNRFALGKRIESLINSRRHGDVSFGLIYIDLDDFKQVNDCYGHRIGDLYLQEAARRMQHALRPNDMLARLGGDEFVIVISAIHHRSEVEEITHRIDRCFADPLVLDGNALRGTASVGIAIFPEDGGTQDALLSAADAAMYRAKREAGVSIGR